MNTFLFFLVSLIVYYLGKPIESEFYSSLRQNSLWLLIVKKICFVLFVRSFVCLFFYLFPIASIFSPLYGFIFGTSQEIIRLIFHLIVINSRKDNLLIRMVRLTLLRTLWGRHDRKGLWGPWNTLVTHQTIQNYVSLHRNPVITLVSRNVKDFAVSAVDV